MYIISYTRSGVRHVFPGKIVGAPLKEDPKIVKKMWAVWHGFVCKKGARDSPFSWLERDRVGTRDNGLRAEET